ncbi:hypothetical protein BY996DRAFT_6442163 [Phakopsora pachyrhizi]|nr:hypothetical protein BY996DRAFT_6442163 [Phakopsora pachyrhizi]
MEKGICVGAQSGQIKDSMRFMFDGMKVKSDNTLIKPDMINKTQTKVMIEIGLEVKMWKSKLEALRLSPLESKFRISSNFTLKEEEEFVSDAVDCESDGKEE